jgi:regulatory protein
VNANKPDNSKSTTSKSALNTALRILTPRDHSKYELVQKLKQRGFSRDDIDDAVSACERFDYINDARTAKEYIRQLKRKGYGKKRIKLEFNKKGLKGSRIQGILDDCVSLTDEREGAEQILRKHMQRFEREREDSKRRDKIYRFLHARGFAQEVISETIKSCSPRDNSKGSPAKR